MLPQRVNNSNIEVVLNIVKLTFYFIVFAIKDNAIPENTETIPPANLSASYLHSFSRLLKGESHTIHAIYGFLSAYIRAVTAPILLPQSPIELTEFKDLK